VLLDATEMVLGQHGFARTTTNRIAERAGVSIGTLYRYFPSAEALVEAVVHRMWARELELFEARAAEVDAQPLSLIVRALVDALVGQMSRQRVLYMRWYGEASHLGRLDLGLKMTERAVDLVEGWLRTHQREVRTDNTRFAADLAVKTTMAVVRTAARDYPEQTASGELARELAEMITRYLTK
jgi:AcrR family transcriptional regulator